MPLAVRSPIRLLKPPPPTGELRILGSWLELFAMPVLLVGVGGRTLFANRRAHTLLGAPGPLFLTTDGLLRAARVDESARLRRLLERPARAPLRRTATVRVSRDAGQLPLLLVVARLGDPCAGAEHDGAVAAAVFITDPEAAPETSAERLAELYELTPAEAGLAEALLLGKSLAEHAADRGITCHTVRTYLKRVFFKTGATRQADLVRILLCGAAPTLLRED